MHKTLTITACALVAAGVAAGCSSERRVVRTETVERVPAAPVVERQTTVRTVPPSAPAIEERTTTYQSGSVEHRTKTTTETIED
jgi:hypothetical protein